MKINERISALKITQNEEKKKILIKYKKFLIGLGIFALIQFLILLMIL
jgi:hypothetical protein